MIKRFGVVIGVLSRPHGQKNWTLATGPRNCQTGTQHQQRAAAGVCGDVAQVGVAQEASVRDPSQYLMWGHVGAMRPGTNVSRLANQCDQLTDPFQSLTA